MPHMRSIGLGIWIRVGGRYENSENKGISHFLEHMVFKGTQKYSCDQLKQAIEGVGGSLNGFTSEELTCYFVKIPAEFQARALDVLSEMALYPSILKKEADKERGVILEEIKMYKDLPQNYVHELLDGLLWPDQPLGLGIAGEPSTVTAITEKEMRLFKEKYYTSSNIVVSACGLLEHEQFSAKVSKIFSGLKNKGFNVCQSAVQHKSGPSLKVMEKTTEQTHLALGFHGFNRNHPLRHALAILHIILGGNMSSRLFNEVREKRGLAYDIGTQVKRFQDTGAFIVHAGIDNSKVYDAINVILNELSKTSDKLISSDEFKRAKEFYIGQLILALEDTLDQMLWAGESLISVDRIYTAADIIKEVKRVTLEDIRLSAQEIFQNKSLSLALIGPLKGQENRIRDIMKIK